MRFFFNSVFLLFFFIHCSAFHQTNASSENREQRDLAQALPSVALQEKDFRSYYSDEFPNTEWSFADSCIELKSQGFGGDLMTRKRYLNFEATFKMEINEGMNSGFLFQVQEGAQYSYLTGLEIQLLHDSSHPDGRQPLTAHGSLYGLSPANSFAKSQIAWSEKWHHFKVKVVDENLEFWMNGVLLNSSSLTNEFLEPLIANSKFKNFQNFNKKKEGHLLFQNHGSDFKVCDLAIISL